MYIIFFKIIIYYFVYYKKNFVVDFEILNMYDMIVVQLYYYSYNFYLLIYTNQYNMIFLSLILPLYSQNK
ncbi:hypothetical protein DERP_014412 [Dermatophagoides pteronyssinus]|uniref:Uncharacterized protein n=1 Tax=Dermatophagoides pteronyssinus TaxID=6956 RepID=A0ABQ8J5Z4_DERPT|nr:hypothetical protein DERP_014412 [Dermatophagoides pteronyssinus]